LQEAEKHKAPTGTVRQRKKAKRFTSYATLMTSLVNEKPSIFEEAIKKKEWKEAMMKEYQSIMKNDVWEVVPRPKEKSVVTSKWVYKINHVVDGSIDKYKAKFVLECSPKRRENIMMRCLLRFPDIHLSEP
jgi:hypothetical protein